MCGREGRRLEHAARDRRLWIFFSWLLGGWLKRKFNFTPERVEVAGPYLVLLNHATDWDPLLASQSFRKNQMYYVASEHIFRWGLVWRVINWILHPIPRLKGTTASDTVLAVVRRLKKGGNVAIFAEGNRCWDGRTGEISPSTAKLARMCGATLITYRFTGGYFTSPRWAGASLRRGKMTGRAVGVYSHEELRAMTAEQVGALIRRDLFEDAYATQRAEPVAYRGKALAEGLEQMLCLCPVCGKIGTLASRNDTLRCAHCGLTVTYDEYGFLSGEGLPFHCIPDWDAWQTGELRRIADEAGSDVVFSDEGAALTAVLEGHKSRLLGTGELSLRAGALCCAGREFPLDEISGMGLYGPLGMSFTCGGGHYDIRLSPGKCLRKYNTTYNYLREKAHTGKDTVRC
jgi:ribosomal protein S27AE